MVRVLRPALRPVLLGGLFALAALLVACSSSSTGSTATPAPASTATATSTATPAGTAATTATTAATAESTVNVTLDEWSVKAAPATVPAGKVTFHVKNAGTVPHEMVVIQTDLAPDKLPIKGSAVDTAKLKVIDTLTQFKAGSTKDLTVTLPAGKYVLICNLPGHYQLGMRTGLTVQ